MPIPSKQQKPHSNILALAAIIVIVLIILSIAVISQMNNAQAPDSPKEKIVDVKIVIESNIDWSGSVTVTGPDYGFYPISGQMDDSTNNDNATYTYQYKADYADLDIQAQFTQNYFGQGITIYDGFLHAREYINGVLEFEKTLTPFTSTGFSWSYDAGYSGAK